MDIIIVVLICSVIGAGMLCYWSVALMTGSIPEIKTEPFRIYFHIAAELLTAILLVFSAFCLYWRLSFSLPVFYSASGMLIYTSISSSGYFVLIGKRSWVLLFFVTMSLSMFCMYVIFNLPHYN